MSIRNTGSGFPLSRRKLVTGTAAGTALAALGGAGRWSALAQDATPAASPAASPAAAACGEPFDAGLLSTVTMVSDGSPITVAIVPKLVHPFFEDCRIGADEEAKKLGVNFEWVSPQTSDAAIQVKMIEDLISKQVNAIVISPNEPTSVVDVINDGLSKGILMMTFDSDSPDSNRVMYIGTNNKTAGMVQGDAMREALGGAGKLGIITGGLGALNLNERIDGLKETIGPDIEIVEIVPTDDDLQKALGVSEALLRAHPDLNGIACVSATGGPTLAQIIQGPEFADRDIKIIAFDDLEEVLRAIEDGIILATMVQRPVQMGVQSISQSFDILTKGVVPECALLDTGVTVVNKDNLTTYTK
jgi:ribose transport system substrate-binding protein